MKESLSHATIFCDSYAHRNSVERIKIFSSLLQRDGCTLCSSGEIFFQSKANSMPSRYIWPLIVIFWSSEAHGSVTKPLIRRRKFSSHQDVFLPLASRVSCIHLPVFSGEMYKVKNTQHQTLLASAIYCAAKVKVLPATFVHQLCTLALAAQ